MTDQPEPAVDVRELARVLGVSVDTVYALARSGRIPSVRVGRAWRFRVSEVWEHLHRQRDPWEQPWRSAAAHRSWAGRRARGTA